MSKRDKNEPHYLLIGAGVTGSYFAARLQRAGVQVTILCRQARQDFIRENGIVLTEHFTRTRSHLAVRTALEPSDEYDYVLIFLPTHRTGELLPLLESLSRARAFVFFGNNAGGFEEAKQRLGVDRVLAAFPAVVGVRENGIVRYADSPKASKKPFNTVTVGETEEPNNRAVRRLKHSFGRAHIRVRRSTRMEEYLLTRAAVSVPLSLGLYGTRHKPDRLAADRERLRLIIRAYKELGLMIRSRGYRIIPFTYRLLLGLPEALLAVRLKRFLESPFAPIAYAAHTGEARKEVRTLYGELRELGKRSGSELPSMEELYKGATRSRSRS
jgi:ketopantoate reductase